MTAPYEFNGQQYAVIGDPIGHSLSPLMHNAAFQALGIDARYIAVHVVKDDLPAFVESAKKHLAGFNILIIRDVIIIHVLFGHLYVFFGDCLNLLPIFLIGLFIYLFIYF